MGIWEGAARTARQFYACLDLKSDYFDEGVNVCYFGLAFAPLIPVALVTLELISKLIF